VLSRSQKVLFKWGALGPEGMTKEESNKIFIDREKKILL